MIRAILTAPLAMCLLLIACPAGERQEHDPKDDPGPAQDDGGTETDPEAKAPAKAEEKAQP